MKPQLTDAQISRVQKCLGDGHKLDACKLYMDLTGSSLLEAKQFVENLSNAEPRPSGSAEELEQALVDQVLDLLQSGCKLDAVRLYKESTGKSLMESKIFIEKLVDEFKIPERSNSQSGCVGLILVFVVLGFILQLML